jgi:hypothetical protein
MKTMKHTNRLAVLLAIILSIGCIRPPAPTSAAPAAPNPCVGIASDSNGYGHVTFQLGPDGDVGIVYVQPFWVILQDQLQAVGLGNLKVLDRSLSASGLTASEATNYLKSIPYGNLIRDRCRFDIVGPFLPDIAAGQAKPENYAYSLRLLINGLVDRNPGGTIFVLKFYQTNRAEFTATNSGFGLTPERINAFNDKLTAMCSPDGSLGNLPQVICVDTQPVFEGMKTPYILSLTTQDDYRALFYRTTGFTPRIEAFFRENPDGQLIGDGIHLSLAGRVRLMQYLAEWISRLSDL